MKSIVHSLILSVFVLACEPRDPQVLTREEIQNQFGRNKSGNFNKKENSNFQRSNQILWEQDFDTIGALMLSHELMRISMLPKVIDSALNSEKSLNNQKCVQVSVLRIQDDLSHGSIQFVNCFFSGDTNLSVSGTINFEKRFIGREQIKHYKITTANGPLLYKIRGKRKLIDLYFDLRAEMSLHEELLRTHVYQANYYWTNVRGQTQEVRIDGLIRPTWSTGAWVGNLAYHSNLGSTKGPFFDLNLESIELHTEQKDASKFWCQHYDGTKFKLRFDYKPSMRRTNAELRFHQYELVITSGNSGKEPERNFKFDSFCQNRWVSSELGWLINPALVLVE